MQSFPKKFKVAIQALSLSLLVSTFSPEAYGRPIPPPRVSHQEVGAVFSGILTAQALGAEHQARKTRTQAQKDEKEYNEAALAAQTAMRAIVRIDTNGIPLENIPMDKLQAFQDAQMAFRDAQMQADIDRIRQSETAHLGLEHRGKKDFFSTTPDMWERLCLLASLSFTDKQVYGQPWAAEEDHSLLMYILDLKKGFNITGFLRDLEIRTRQAESQQAELERQRAVQMQQLGGAHGFYQINILPPDQPLILARLAPFFNSIGGNQPENLRRFDQEMTEWLKRFNDWMPTFYKDFEETEKDMRQTLEDEKRASQALTQDPPAGDEVPEQADAATPKEETPGEKGITGRLLLTELGARLERTLGVLVLPPTFAMLNLVSLKEASNIVKYRFLEKLTALKTKLDALREMRGVIDAMAEFLEEINTAVARDGKLT